MKKINVITLGCSKNTVDSEHLMAQLAAAGYTVTHDSDRTDAKVVVINTCGFIGDAKQESIDMILRAAAAKQAGRIDRLFVVGCLSERYADELRPEWFTGAARVGLTAGASAPEILVRQVIERIKALGAVSVRTMDGIEETIKFPLPKGLKIDTATGLELSQRRPETGSAGH